MNGLVTSKAIWYVMRGSGVVSLLLLTGVVALGIATSVRWRPRELPGFVTAGLHRSVALLSVVFVVLHVASAVLDPYAVVGVAAIFVPLLAGKSAVWVGVGALSVDLVAALIVSSLLRPYLGRRLWSGVHWLAYAAWPLALAHGLGMGSDSRTLWLRLLAASCVAGVLALLAWRVHGRTEGTKRLERRPRPRRLAEESGA